MNFCIDIISNIYTKVNSKGKLIIGIGVVMFVCTLIVIIEIKDKETASSIREKWIDVNNIRRVFSQSTQMILNLGAFQFSQASVITILAFHLNT